MRRKLSSVSEQKAKQSQWLVTSNHIVAGPPYSEVVLVFVPGKDRSCPVNFAEFIFLMFPFMFSSLSYFEHTLTEADVRLQLWRKVAKPQRNGFRKVLAMWMVRKTLNAARTYFWHSLPSFPKRLGPCITVLPDLECFKLSTQGLPATCPGPFTYAIKTTAYDEHETEVNYTDTSCSGSACGDDVLVGQQAHKLNLTVFRDGNQLAEESVYVPALEESEF